MNRGLLPARLAVGVFLAGLLLAPAVVVAEPDEAPDEARALAFLRDWAAAWESQDAARYLELYAADARVGRRDRVAHAAQKSEVFARGETVTVRLGDAEVDQATVAGETLVRATMLQEYSSPSLSDFGRKELLLRATPEGLRIVRETWTRTGGSIDRELAAQLAAAIAPVSPDPEAAAATPRGEPVAESSDLPPEPVFEPLDPERPVVPAAPQRADAPDARTADSGEPVQPLLGEGYAPPAAVADAGTAAKDLLAIEPLVRDDVPGFLRPVSFDGLPGDIDSRTLVEEVVARINGRVLTRSAFVERLEGQHLQLLLEQPSDLERRLEMLVPETLTQTVERWLLVQEAEINRAEVEGFWRNWLAGFRKQVGAGTIDELQELLAAEGMTLTTLREQVVANEVVQQKVTAAIDRSDERLQEYYQQHGVDYALPARVTLSQILMPVTGPGDLPRAEAALEAALAQLTEGAAWCDVHAVYGQGGNCGDLGTLDLEDLLPEMRDVAAGLPIGAISKPIRSSAGLHLVQVRDRADVAVPPFEELAPEIERAVIDLEFNRLLEDYLEVLKETAVIEINPRYASLWEAPGVGQ
jgi:hypothetical protein